ADRQLRQFRRNREIGPDRAQIAIPALRQWRAVEQHPVEIHERTAAACTDGGDEVARLGEVFRLIGDGRHPGSLSHCAPRLLWDKVSYADWIAATRLTTPHYRYILQGWSAEAGR